jgi:AcrR family transcriptional regulator
MNEKAKFILDCAEKLFTRYGIRSVTMDDVAKQAGVSKKTLYQFFNDKNHLVECIIKQFIEHHTENLKEIRTVSENAIDEYYRVIAIAMEEFLEVQPVFMHDLSKFFPGVWNQILEFQHIFIKQYMYENLDRGMKEGLFRNDINLDILSSYYASSVTTLFSHQLFPPSKMNFNELFTELFKYHSNAVMSDKGREVYCTFLKKIESKF